MSIYNILNKLNGLTKTTLTESAKPAEKTYESVDAKGSILEGVNKVEQKLKEEYEKLKTAHGTIHKVGRYGNAYDGGTEADGSPKKRGRPAAGEKRDAKEVKPKGPKGRPKKDRTAGAPANIGNDPFGRVPDKAPKGKKGTVVKGRANKDVDEAMDNPFAVGMAAAKKEVGLGSKKATNLPKKVVSKAHEIGKAVKRSMNESRDPKTSEYTYEIVGQRLAKENPHMDVNSDLFFDAVYNEMVEIGMSPRSARNVLSHDEDFLGDVIGAYNHFGKAVAEATVNPMDVPAVQRKAAGQNFPVTMGQTQDVSRNISAAPTLAQNTGRGPAAELDELAKLAGITTESADCGAMSQIGTMAHEMEQQQGKINVNTNASSDGTKNINISADGEAAEQLMAMLKMAGLGGGEAHAQQADIVIAQTEAKEYGSTDVAEPEEYVNSPREQVSGMRQSPTTGMAGGTDDLNKEKDQDPETANKAANPKAKKEVKLEDANPLDALGAKLMAAYEGIKLRK